MSQRTGPTVLSAHSIHVMTQRDIPPTFTVHEMHQPATTPSMIKHQGTPFTQGAAAIARTSRGVVNAAPASQHSLMHLRAFT
jgi:hypothetical protein